MRRYTEFCDLAQSQHCSYQSGTALCTRRSTLEAIVGALPRKRLSCKGAALEERRYGLEEWLNSLLARFAASWGESSSLIRFLLMGRGWAPVKMQKMSAPQPDAKDVDGALTLVHVKLPMDVGECQQVRVQVPHGRDMPITVPWGVSLGAILNLWYDTKAGTLAVHHS